LLARLKSSKKEKMGVLPGAPCTKRIALYHINSFASSALFFLSIDINTAPQTTPFF
jgi:hypothetical protein